MVERRDLGSWLQGPQFSVGPHSAYPGERLGRPEAGSRSIARPGRRFLGLFIDWVLCWVIAHAIFGSVVFHSGRLLPVVVLVIENLLLVGTGGATFGQRVVGLRVERVDGGRLGFVGTVIRAVLLGLGFPAMTMVWETDRRGLHDLLSGSLVALR